MILLRLTNRWSYRLNELKSYTLFRLGYLVKIRMVAWFLRKCYTVTPVTPKNIGSYTGIKNM